jgi:tetratricopeptide (TPR) repeat protein
MNPGEGRPLQEAESERPRRPNSVPAGGARPSSLAAQAAELWQRGRLDEAEAMLRGVSPDDPGDHLALHMLGLVALRQGNHARAIEVFCQAIAIDDQVAAYHGNLGNAYFRLGRLGEAAGCFRQALALEPGSALAHFGLGTALLGQKVYDAAAAELEAAAVARPGDVDTHLNLGLALTELGRIDEAVAHCQCAVGLDPGRPAAHLGLAAALRSKGALTPAHDHIARAIELDPNLAEAHFQLGLTLQALDRSEAAASALGQALRLRPDMIAARQELDKILKPSVDSDELSVATSSATSILGKPQGGSAADRLNRYLALFMNSDNHPRMGFYPGLTARPWHDPSGFPIVHALEQRYEAICREILALETTEFQSEIEGMSRTGNWDVFLFYERGRKNDENCSRCPVITGIIETHNTVRTLAGLMYASKTRPGTHIVPHQGPTNMRLRVHLGIKIPNGDCGLRVGNEIRRWQEGKYLVFDDYFEHESWNYTKEPRIVLILDVWHPELSASELTFLQGLHRYA